MTLLYAYFYALEEPSVFIDIVFTALCIGIIGAIVYVLFISSIRNDRAERIMSRRARVSERDRDVWSKLEGGGEEDQSEREGINVKKLILILSLVAALAVVLFIIAKRLG